MSFFHSLLYSSPLEALPDNVTLNTNDGFTTFNGFTHIVKYGDILDTTVFSPDNAVFSLGCTIRNVSLSGTMRLLSKTDFAGNNREFILQKVGNDIVFNFWFNGTGTEARAVTWADCLPDTGEHTIRVNYDGSIDTNAGLDRCTLLIDGVTVTAGKSLTTNSGILRGIIFNSTAQLAFGSDVNAAGTVSAGVIFQGDVKDIFVYTSGETVQLHSLDIDVSATLADNGTYDVYVQPIVDGTKNSLAQDTCQVTVNSMVDTGTHWYLYYLASNPNINSDRDETCVAIKEKNNDVTTGWDKRLSGGLPEVVYTVGSVGKFDAKQCWLRNVRKLDDGTYEAFPVGQSAVDAFAMGYATSPDGLVWTRGNSGDAIFNDGTTDFTMGHVIFDEDDQVYKMLYTGNNLGETIKLAETSGTDPMTGWAVTQTITGLQKQYLGWPVKFMKISGYYYVWCARRFKTFSGISDDIVAYRSTDLITFEYLGAQVQAQGSTEYGITSTIGLAQKPNGNYFMTYSGYKNQIGKAANSGEEFTFIKVAELNRSDLPIAGRQCRFNYPSYVVRHYPLSDEESSGLNFNEMIEGGVATINTTPVFTQLSSYANRTLGFVDLSGTQTITDATPLPASFDFANFAVKLRVEVLTTGTHELFSIGSDVLVTLESGNLRVRLSSDGVTYQKDYISTADLSKPTGMNYIDDHIYVGFTFIGGVLTLYNDFNAFTVTKTVDDALATVNNSGSSIEIGSTANLQMRSVSILTGATDAQFIALEI